MNWDGLQRFTWDQVGSLTWEEALKEIDYLIEKIGSSQEPLPSEQAEQLRELDAAVGGDGSGVPVKTGDALTHVRDIVVGRQDLWSSIAYIIGCFVRGLYGF